MITKRDKRGRPVLVDEFKAPRVINKSGFVFNNARGGPYKYGFPLKASRDNLRLRELGLL